VAIQQNWHAQTPARTATAGKPSNAERPSQNVKRPGVFKVFKISWSERSNYDSISVSFNCFAEKRIRSRAAIVFRQTTKPKCETARYFIVFMLSWSERSNYDRIYVPFNLFLVFRQPNYDRIYDSCIYFICFRQPNYGCISM